MQRITRRTFVGMLCASSVAAMLPGALIPSAQAKPVGTREFDISQFDRMLLPREHGQLSKIKPLTRRYPSRDHCMQMAAFFNNKKGLLIIANDPEGGVADWQIRADAVLKIHFYERIPDIIVMGVEPTLEAAAAAYKSWASEQFWIKGRKRSAPKLDFVSVASSSSMAVESTHLNRIFSSVEGTKGVWFTLWRSSPFDRNYPDYTAKEPYAFARQLAYITNRGGIAFPYINGLLWDQNLNLFRDTGNKIAIRNDYQHIIPYNTTTLDFLQYACPFSEPWQTQIVSARNSLKDSSDRLTGGVYLDMLAAAPPIVCWSSDHGHKPGDASCWRTGIRQLLKKINGLIMIEGCAEVYLDLFDYPLMHLHTLETDIVPLWSLVYGEQVQSLGWRLPIGVNSEQFKKILDKSQAMGLGGFASPWLTTEPEAELVKRKVMGSFAKPKPQILQINK